MGPNARSSTSAPDPAAVARLYGSQRGLVTPAQLRSAGVSPELQQVRIERGEWEWYAPGVVGLCGVPDDWRRPLTALTLASSRAAVTGPTALRHLGYDGFADDDRLLAVARMADRPRLPTGFRLWRSRRLTDDDVVMVDGIRTTIAPTALVHAAPFADADRFDRAVDDLLRRVESPVWAQRVADRWRGPGVPGSGILSAALAERCDRRLPRSWFERLAQRVLREHGVLLEHEFPVYDHGRLIAVLDLADLEWKVGVECQSWEHHATPAARQRDARRKRRLTQLGWEIVELWWSDLGNVAERVAEIADARERQRLRRAGAAARHP